MILEHIKEVFVAQHRVDFRMGVFGLKAEMNKILLLKFRTYEKQLPSFLFHCEIRHIQQPLFSSC